MLGSESDAASEVLHHTDEQTGADEQQQRHGHLRDDQRLGEWKPCVAEPCRVALERRTGIGARDVHGRRKAEEDPGRHRDQTGKGQQTKIELKRRAHGEPARREERDEQCGAPSREQQTERAADHAQEDALRQKLTDDPRPRCAEREPNRDFSLPRICARQQQAGDVRARQQQHETDDGHQDPERA